MKRQFECVCIAGDRASTLFMQHCDVFESFKIVATPTRMQLTLDGTRSLEEVLAKLRSHLESGGFRVAAIFCPNISEGAWRDPEVKLVSNGERFCSLDDMLKVYGWPIETAPA